MPNNCSDYGAVGLIFIINILSFMIGLTPNYDNLLNLHPQLQS